MSTLSNIFASDNADQAQSASQPADAATAPPPPDLPGDDGGSVTATDTGGDPYGDAKGPDVLMPGGEMDPAA